LPELLADQDGGEHGQHAGQIIQPDHVEYIQHAKSGVWAKLAK
jgi:hypothetical protein